MSCDITKRGSSLIRATSSGATVTFPSGQQQIFPNSTYAIDLRVAAQPNVIAVAALAGNDQPGQDFCRVLTDRGDTWDSGEPTVGENCVAIRTTAAGGFEVAYIRYLTPSEQGRFYRRVLLSEHLEVQSVKDAPVATPDGSTTQGFSDWTSDEPSFTDNRRVIKLGGVNFSQPMTRGEWTVGLHDDNRILLFDHASQRVLVSNVTSQKVARLELSGADVPEVAATGENVFLKLSEFVDLGATPDPEPEPEPMPEPPDHSHIIRQVNDAFPHLLQTNTRDTCREFLWRCTWALHQADKRWGFLSKTEGENHVTIPDVGRVAIDAVTYRDWDGAVDIIANNSNPPEAGRPFWDVVGKRPSSVWVQPVPFGGSGEPPTPEPEPDPNTHKYMGGGNDTGTCDECGRNRNDAIHAIPASKKPHAYDGGEQDTGQCDICQKPKGDAIHQPGQPQPEPEPEPPANGGELRELRKLVEELTNQCDRIETRQRDHTALLEGIQLQIEKLGERVAPAAYEGPIELRAGFIGAVRGTGKFTAVKD